MEIKKYSVSVILPTLNEEVNVVLVIHEIFRNMPDAEIIVVDDCSTDFTRERVKELQGQYENLILIERNIKHYISAIKDGIKRSSGELITWLDCDLSHPPVYLVSMKNYIEADQAEVVVASRFLPASRDTSSKGLGWDIKIHKLLSKFLNKMCSVLLCTELTDFTSGFIMIKKDVLRIELLTGNYGEYFIELLYHLNKLGVRILEIPYDSPPRLHGESKTMNSLLDFVRKGFPYLITIGKIIFTSREGKSKIHKHT